MNILPLFLYLSNLMSAPTLRQLQIIAARMLCSSGRSTQLGISEWTKKGGGYRIVNRFSHTDIDWDQTLQQFWHTHHHDPSTPNILIADETVISKSGKRTHGFDRFYSSMASKPIPAVAVFTIAMVHIHQHKAIPVSFEQVHPNRGIGLSFFMESLGRALLKPMRKEFPDAGILDLKSYARGARYVSEVMKYLQEKPEAINWDGVLVKVSRLGFIHNVLDSKNPVFVAT